MAGWAQFLRVMGAFVVVCPLLLGCGDVLGPFGGVAVTEMDSVFVLADPDFEADGEKPVELPAPEIEAGSLQFQARITPQDTGVADPPMSLLLEVVVRNPADTAVTLEVRGCTVLPQVYRTPDRVEPMWDWGSSGFECVQAPYSRVVPPRDVYVFSTTLAEVDLGSLGSDGRYYFSAEFRRTAGDLTLDAGSADVQLQKRGLEYRVSLRQDGRGASAQVEVRNTNSVSVPLEYGSCALSLALYRDRARTQLAAPWRLSGLCPGYLATASLKPEESLVADEFRRRFDSSQLPGDELEARRYFLEVQLRLNWRTLRFPAGAVEVW